MVNNIHTLANTNMTIYEIHRIFTRNLCLLYLAISFICCEQVYFYEFESVVGGPGTSRSPWRSAASNVSALHLYEGDMVEISICLQQTTEIFIAGIEYSNDGPSDTIKFTSDGDVVGELVTEPTTEGWGEHWNIKKWYGPIGNPFSLSPGTHVFRIYVTSTDCYGTEIDRLIFASPAFIAPGLFCGAKLTVAETPTPCAAPFEGSVTKAATSAGRPTTTSSSPSKTPTSVTLTTTSESVSSSTTPTTMSLSTTPSPVRVEQHSLASSCLDNSNIVVKFNGDNLIGTKIVAKSTPNAGRQLNNTYFDKSELFCGNTFMWQIGEVNRNNNELGPMWSEDHIDYVVNSHDSIQAGQKPFPGEVDPKKSHEIVIRYVIPKHITLKGGKVRFIVGLIDVSNNITVGLQTVRRHKKDPSNIKYNTFTPKQQVKKWVVPIRGISPSLENQLVLYFDEKTPQHIKFDFLGLEFLPASIKTRPIRLTQKGLWKIRGRLYQRGKKREQKIKGMKLMINGQKGPGAYESVYIIRKPNKEILAVYNNGKIYPTHESKLSKKSRDKSDYKQNDVTGITFKSKDISQVNINTDSQMLTIIYDDSTKVKLSFKYTKIKSTFTIENISMKPETMSFFSTYVSPTSAAINDLIVDNKQRMDVMDPNINGITGNSFKFVNTALKPLYNDKFEILFP